MCVKLNEMGERKAIDSLMSLHKRQSKKDDCSLIPFDGSFFLLSADSITPATHIPAGASAEQSGSFFANTTISDIAGMAGVPDGFMAAYISPPETDFSYYAGFEQGVESVLKKHEMEHLGGDFKEGSTLSMTGVAVGHQTSDLVRRRGDIKSGHIVGVTNNLGRAASGYVYYETGYQREKGIEMMLGAKARIQEAQAISRNGGRFMMDLSDGIFSSVRQMKQDYGLGFKLVEDSAPIDPHVEKAAELSGASLRELLFSYGGDYELLFTIDNENYGKFIESMESEGINVSIIGQVWDGDNMIFDGERWEVVAEAGYEHFSEKPKLGKIG